MVYDNRKKKKNISVNFLIFFEGVAREGACLKAVRHVSNWPRQVSIYKPMSAHILTQVVHCKVTLKRFQGQNIHFSISSYSSSSYSLSISSFILVHRI